MFSDIVGNDSPCTAKTSSSGTANDDCPLQELEQLDVKYKDYREVMEKVHSLEKENLVLKREKNEAVKRENIYKNKCLFFENVREVNYKNRKVFFEQCNAILGPYFSSTQIKIMIGQSSRRVYKWSDDDIRRAFTLKSVSSKAYRYIRNIWKVPLPSPSTLNRYIQNINFEPGILKTVLQFADKTSEMLAPMDKLCSLSFDEMSIEKKYVYDRGADKLYGPHSKVQVAMIRGITSSWKQPVFL